jgi:hypothetical protein
MQKLPMVIPCCKEHKTAKLVYQKPHTKEQAWVGTAYKCPECNYSVHYPSQELLIFLQNG